MGWGGRGGGGGGGEGGVWTSVSPTGTKWALDHHSFLSRSAGALSPSPRKHTQPLTHTHTLSPPLITGPAVQKVQGLVSQQPGVKSLHRTATTMSQSIPPVSLCSCICVCVCVCWFSSRPCRAPSLTVVAAFV